MGLILGDLLKAAPGLPGDIVEAPIPDQLRDSVPNRDDCNNKKLKIKNWQFLSLNWILCEFLKLKVCSKLLLMSRVCHNHSF